MQRTLSITVDKKTIVSKPFDFETMCIINDAHNDESKKGPLNICRDAVDHMFEGTAATQEIINGLDVGVRSKLCLKVWEFYLEALSTKNG